MPIQVEYCLRIVAAALCGIALGYERYRRYKAAGPRVFCIVCSTAALLMILSKYGFYDMATGDDFVMGTHGADPSRIAAGVIGGISFICLAIIYRNKNTLRGLTTAAGLLMASAIGLAIGAGMYITGFFAAVFTLLIQTIMHRLYIDNDSVTNRDVSVRMVNDPALRDVFIEDLKALGAEVSGRSIVRNSDGTITYSFMMKTNNRIHFEEVAAIIESHPDEFFDLKME